MLSGSCKLCLLVKELRDSHYIPRRAYSMNMAKSLPNPNPVVISHGKLKQVSDQLRGYTFCGDCEQMLSDKGEKWVLANVPEDQGSPFPLQDALIPEKPVFINGDFNIYEGRKIKAFNLGKGPFPADIAVVVHGCSDHASKGLIFFPTAAIGSTYATYSLLVRGVYFRLLTGLSPSAHGRQLCIVNSPKHVIFEEDCDQRTRHAYGHLRKTAKVAKQLK